MVVCSPRFILLVVRKTGAFPIKSAVQNIFFRVLFGGVVKSPYLCIAFEKQEHRGRLAQLV